MPNRYWTDTSQLVHCIDVAPNCIGAAVNKTNIKKGCLSIAFSRRRLGIVIVIGTFVKIKPFGLLSTGKN